MNSACRQFAGGLGALPKEIHSAFNSAPPTIPPKLMEIADTFLELQNERHEADYNLLRRFTRADALILVQRAAAAFDQWEKIAATQAAKLFLIWLLVSKLRE
jgi:hypothetical protein